ncbi:MAG: ABC transporter permease [Tissierellia bacterium]|nr:ABC transporter permease [Tissierellia bacterium]
MKLNSIFRKYGIIIVLTVLIVAFGIGNKLFFTVSNFINIIRQISILGIITIGMSFVLISGGIDLSVGSQLSFIGVVTATMFTKYDINPLLACSIGILIATLVGTMNGVFIANTKVPPLIATLAMQQILLGLGYIISKGKPIYGLTQSVKFIGQGHIGPIPTPIIILIIFIVIGSFVLNKTYLGRYFYAIGSNDEVARLSGINVKLVRTLAYAMCGFLSGIAAIIMMSRINSGSPTVGSGFEMDVLTAAVLGGVSVSGGEGKIFGAMVGALIIGVLSNGLIIMNVSEYYQMVIKGLVLACAIAFDSVNNKKMQSNAL